MSKTGPGITKTAPRITDRSAEFYRQSFSSLNAGLEYMIDSYPQLYRLTLHSLKGRFCRGELMLMLDVNNGLWLTAQHAGQHLSAQVADGIALDELDKKWQIDGPDLNAKVGALTIFESACLEIWTRAFWEAASRENQDIEEYVRVMASS